MKKIDPVKLIGAIGSTCTIVGTIIAGYTNTKNMEAMIDKKVQEAIKNLNI